MKTHLALLITLMAVLGFSSEGHSDFTYSYSLLLYPEAVETFAYGIIDNKHIVGTYKTGLAFNGFMYDGVEFTTMAYPDPAFSDTWARKINYVGQIVGHMYDLGNHQSLVSCPAASNPDQTDSDGDGVSDTCDNCPGLANPWQHDGDGDNAGDACDNCLAVANSGRAEFDIDGLGDDCDCQDGYWGPGEDGGDCPHLCPTMCVPAIQYGEVDGKIDILFIPSEEYAAVEGDELGMSATDSSGVTTRLPLQWRPGGRHRPLRFYRTFLCPASG